MSNKGIRNFLPKDLYNPEKINNEDSMEDNDPITLEPETDPIDKIVDEVMDGKWDQGLICKVLLERAGYDYGDIMGRVQKRREERHGD